MDLVSTVCTPHINYNIIKYVLTWSHKHARYTPAVSVIGTS